MIDLAIDIKNVSKYFEIKKEKNIFEKFNFSHKRMDDKFLAVDNISAEIPKGELLAIIGRNGSGKTTLLRLIAGIYQPNSGSIKVNGNIAPMLHLGSGFKEDLVARENIILFGLLYGIPKSVMSNKIDNIIEFAEIQKFSEMKIKHYSTGMKMKLAFSTALQLDPDIILMDEALSVGDQSFRQKSFESFKSFRKRGKTILYTTHILESIVNFSDRVLLLDQGKMIMLGDPKEVIEKYKELIKTK